MNEYYISRPHLFIPEGVRKEREEIYQEFWSSAGIGYSLRDTGIDIQHFQDYLEKFWNPAEETRPILDRRTEIVEGLKFLRESGKMPVLGTFDKKSYEQWASPDWKPSSWERIERRLIAEKNLIGIELRRSKLFLMDLDKKADPGNPWLKLNELTEVCESPHGWHQHYENDTHIVWPTKKKGFPPPIRERQIFKDWRKENPVLWQALESWADITRFRGISWVPPSKGYRWKQPLKKPMKLSEALRSLSK